MESSEDDAGTATNASRRASAREKDVGLAEDVNATSSFQQKASEARSSCQTPAMSEDNFDGDSVPSPSSQDVNTSTEAILDMIDEIVDGPGAPRRIPLTSECVDALNEELATTSYNLNIIQESAKSDCETVSLPEVASSVNIAHSEPTLPVISDTLAERSTPTEIPADNLKTDRLGTLPASSSVVESDEKAVSTDLGASVVLNVESETPTSCPLPNIPSSSAEQTEKNVSDISECEPQDRTVKCITSSDTRDNVTVESAESTSSDSSVSKSKGLLVEPQVRSPLRRRLVRPAPSDRRPDSTVSSTVDSQTVDIPTADEPSSESITKDVTSSSDAVPTIHGNVKPEEIRNVSEIHFCKAETSMNPPKKIKLIRQKITGTSNRETPLGQSDLAEKGQCQSTSSDNHTVNLHSPTTKSSSVDSLSKPQDPNGTPILDNSSCVTKNLPEPPSDTHKTISSDEHSQSSIVLHHSPKNDGSNKGNDCGKLMLDQIQSLSSAPDAHTTEQDSSSVPTPNSNLIKVNDLESDHLRNTYDKEHKSMDFIPLRLSPRRIEQQSKSSELVLRNTDIKSKKSDIEPTNTEQDSKNHTHQSSQSEPLELKSNEVELNNQNRESTNHDSMSSKHDTGSNDLELEVRNTELIKVTNRESNSRKNYMGKKEQQSTSNELTSSSMEVQSQSKKIESQTTIFKPKSTDLELQTDDALKSKSTEAESKSAEVESKSTEVEFHSMKSEPKSTCLRSQSTKIEPQSPQLQSMNADHTIEKETRSEVPILKATERKPECTVEELNRSNVLLQKTIIEPESTAVQSPNTELETKTMVSKSTATAIEPMSIETKSSTTERKLKDILQPNVEFASGQSKIEVPMCAQMASKESELGLTCNKVQNIVSSNMPEVQNSEATSKRVEIESISPAIKAMNSEIEPKASETKEKTTELDSKNKQIGSSILVSVNCQADSSNEQPQEDQKKVPPIKLNLSRSSMSNLSESILVEHSSINKNDVIYEESDSNKQVPKLTIKLKQTEELKSPVPKLTIKPLKPPVDKDQDNKMDNIQQVPCVTKINIKPILKPPEKINDIHRKSSSSEISESECSENDETTSTSDQASTSDQGSSDVVPKVTIKLGKPGTECEGQFYTEKNVPKLTIKGIQQDEKLIISQSDDVQPEKVPKLTIKTITKADNQPLSPKLTIKPLKPPDSTNREGEIPKVKMSSELFSLSTEGRESPHVPKITIKPVTRIDGESRTPKKSMAMSDSPEHIPVVTKLNIKPILKPTDCGESSESFDDKVPVVSKLNIKPVMKPKDNDIDSSVDDVPKITKLNIKPLKNPEDKNSEDFKDCDALNAVIDENSIPVVTKINIKPIIKPQEEEKEKDSENQSSETGNSSDDNTDHIPVVTKLNIKPIIKPDELQESSKSVSSSDQSIPIITKLNIKPLVKPPESSPSSPKKEHSKMDVHSTTIPVVTKLNIKPVLRPEDVELPKSKDDDDKISKNPPLVMKINMKSVTESFNHDSSHKDSSSNYVGDGLLSIAQKNTKIPNEIEKSLGNKEHKSSEPGSVNDLLESRIIARSPIEKSLKQNCVPDEENTEKTPLIKKTSLHSPISKPKPSDVATEKQHSPKIATVTATKCDSIQTGSPLHDSIVAKEGKMILPNETHREESKNIKFRPSVQNCTLLKKLLENTRDSLDKKFEKSQVVNCTLLSDRSESTLSMCKNIVNNEHLVELGKSGSDRTITRNLIEGSFEKRSATPEKLNDLNKSDSNMLHPMHELSGKVNENVTKPLEITISDKITNQSSGQDSPRIILKINKTDHGPSAKIITEDVKRPDTILNYADNTQDNVNDKQSPKRQVANSRRKQQEEASLNLSSGKRLRSSRIVENTEKSQVKRNIGKRPSTTETTPPQSKESELSVLQTKRLKLGQLLSGNKSPISPVSPIQTSPTKINLEAKPGVKTVNHSILNNENCSKNGNSKLHNILSNLQAKQMQSLPFNNTNCSEKSPTIHSDVECNASMSSTEAVENTPIENSHPELQEMIINENSDFRDFTGPEDTSQDPLEVDNTKPVEEPPPIVDIPKPVELTPQPRKRGRPRKLPVSEGAKAPVVSLPVPALEERPQRSLRLMRDRPAILQKPRGRGRGRGGRRSDSTTPIETETITIIETAPEDQTDEKPSGEIDPTSSRIKLPRMTEALDKMPSVCVTPLSSRRRNSSGTFSSTGETSELKVLLDGTPSSNEFPNTPEPTGSGRGRGGRGSRGGRGRTPRGRGRGRGGGRGAMYMKETLGIYGRVCGPATTTVQLFEEETCMMDDNATPAKPSHLLDEDSQGSVKSSTNESSKMKKSKFADLFDSSKVWTAADVKEYTWPSPDSADGESKVMMIQEQVAMFLGVKSFKRRYPELKRRTIGGEERDYVLSKGLVTEALCDLGITAVDASEILDIMLSDYPHKYEEFRSHQRQRQLTEVLEEPIEEPKLEEKVTRVEIKQEKPVEHKPELPKIDPEKTRQDMAAAAIASASEWNARANAARRSACADLQSFTVLRPRPRAVPPARPHLRPPAGFYPHALLPGQYQHSYRVYAPDQLRYFPLNTALAAPPAPPSVTDSSSESEADWGSRCSSSDDSDIPTHHTAKRKKLTKVKRSSQIEASTSSVKEEPKSDEVVDTCRVCKLRLEANRKYTHERFLVCANCNAKLHPGCVELSADTIRKCREYGWQCAECKTCCACRQPADDDKMLFCDLCDRGFHIYCVGLDTVPSGRWHCVECAICKSCGARSPSGPAGGSSGPGCSSGPGGSSGGEAGAEWHHQTRRGPGGHKVYSHSLCTPCARAYRIGRYCPLCERSFIGPKGTMQLVICKLCDRQLHQECVRRSGAALRVLDHTCGWCRRGGITSRAAAVRLAPRTIATLFMAKRRFNKYAHKQYMQSRLRQGAPDDPPSPPTPPAPPTPPHLV